VHGGQAPEVGADGRLAGAERQLERLPEEILRAVQGPAVVVVVIGHADSLP
jgi:hypothetical protein